MTPPDKKSLLLPTLTLLTSMSTLICCALPALLVTLGAGAVMAGLVSAVPQLVFLSAHKKALFIIAALLLLVAGSVQWKNRHAPCPADPAQAIACQRLRKTSHWIFGFALAAYIIGFFFAFVAVHLF